MKRKAGPIYTRTEELKLMLWHTLWSVDVVLQRVGGLVLVSWGKSPLCCLTVRPVLVKMSLLGVRGEVWWAGGWEMASHPVTPSLGRGTCHSTQEGLVEKWTVSQSVSQALVGSLPSACLCLALGTSGATVLCFIFDPWLGFKTPNRKGLSKLWAHSPCPEVSLEAL